MPLGKPNVFLSTFMFEINHLIGVEGMVAKTRRRSD
jgi:hypothetical protein